MKKFKFFLILFVLLIIYVYVTSVSFMPDNIVILQGEKINLFKLWGITLNSKYSVETLSSQESKLDVGKINLNVSLFNNFNLKEVNVSVIPKTTVIPLGNAVGLKLYTNGVLVVGMSDIEGIKPYENTGIEEGDRIIKVNNTALTCTQDLIDTVNKSNGEEVKLKYISLNNEEKEVNILPAKTNEDEYKLGLWVRDASAGVGTLTFYEPSSRNVCIFRSWSIRHRY